jgi:hypothetical protein
MSFDHVSQISLRTHVNLRVEFESVKRSIEVL